MPIYPSAGSLPTAVEGGTVGAAAGEPGAVEDGTLVGTPVEVEGRH